MWILVRLEHALFSVIENLQSTETKEQRNTTLKCTFAAAAAVFAQTSQALRKPQGI